MDAKELIKALKSLSVETGSLACLGCGYEHSCGIRGCAILREAVRGLKQVQPLTLDELQRLVGDVVWCADTDGIAPGLVCLRDSWDDHEKELHICILDGDGNPGIYNMHTMMECGAKFYRRKPEQED